MKIDFSKYHGAGNDFIIVDGRQFTDLPSGEKIEIWCNRHKGIGADGLIILYPKNHRNVKMHYFNSDGKESSLCGNGGRCVAAWCRREAGFQKEISIHAWDGIHHAAILAETESAFEVALAMHDADLPLQKAGGFFIDTGSPHHIHIVDDVQSTDVISAGRKVRMSEEYAPEGTNVNFINIGMEGIVARTYERGVENETLACGTGAVAIALVSAYLRGKYGECRESIDMPGGKLEVSFKYSDKGFSEIVLRGPAEFVFSGRIESDHG